MKPQTKEQLRYALQSNRARFGKGRGDAYWNSVIKIIEAYYEKET